MIYIILLGILIYNLLYFCNFFGTYGVSGSIQVPINHFLLYYKSLFCNNNNSQIELLKYDNDYTTIYGYCCRQLFHIFIDNSVLKMLKRLMRPKRRRPRVAANATRTAASASKKKVTKFINNISKFHSMNQY